MVVKFYYILIKYNAWDLYLFDNVLKIKPIKNIQIIYDFCIDTTATLKNNN